MGMLNLQNRKKAIRQSSSSKSSGRHLATGGDLGEIFNNATAITSAKL